MTQYLHTITLTDGERGALDDALSLMIAHCNEQLAAGAGAPFWAHRESCRTILATPTMISTYVPYGVREP